jgi:hypothetical protein
MFSAALTGVKCPFSLTFRYAFGALLSFPATAAPPAFEGMFYCKLQCNVKCDLQRKTPTVLSVRLA